MANTAFPTLRAAGLAIVLVVSACAPGANLPVLHAENASEYRLGPGDKVRIITYGEDQLSREFSVESNGELTLPLLGAVRVQGLTTDQLARNLATALDQRKILHDANVSVEVASYRPFFILGEVNKPGEYPYQPGMTLLTAVALAGGFTYRAEEDRAFVVRHDSAQTIEGVLVPQSQVEPGDAIKIYERLF